MLTHRPSVDELAEEAFTLANDDEDQAEWEVRCLETVISKGGEQYKEYEIMSFEVDEDRQLVYINIGELGFQS